MKPVAIREAEYKRNLWALTADRAVAPHMLLQPSFWAHVGARLKVGDRIEVSAFDGAWLVELLVRSSSRTEARVVMLTFHDLNKADRAAKELTEGDPLEAIYKGPTLKWCVVRKSDGARMVEKLDGKEQAENWIKEPPQAQAA